MQADGADAIIATKGRDLLVMVGKFGEVENALLHCVY